MEAPRTAVYLARVQLAVVAGMAIVGLAGGIGMQLELWAPGPAWSSEHYARMFDLHGLLAFAIGAPVLAGSFGYVAIAELCAARRVAEPALAWIAFGLWAIGVGAIVIVLVIASRGDDASAWTLYTPYQIDTAGSVANGARTLAPFAFGAASVVFALHLGLMLARAWRDTAPAKRAVATVFVLAIAAAAFMPVLAALLAALVLAGLALARDVRPWSVLALVGLGVVPMFGLYMLATSVGRATDLHVHDTYVVVGGYHALAACIAFASLAALHAWGAALLGRVPQTALAVVGAITCAAGMLLHIYASLHLGLRGMPRRYWDYDPQFTTGHQLAGIGAAAVVAGLVLLAVAWACGHAPRDPE
jgi:heme/copper-type cytochrome/quinol oxidase subunit 1